MGSARQTILFNKGPTLQFIGLKGSSVNVLVPGNIANLERSCEVYASMDFGARGGPTQYQTGGFKVIAKKLQ